MVKNRTAVTCPACGLLFGVHRLLGGVCPGCVSVKCVRASEGRAPLFTHARIPERVRASKAWLFPIKLERVPRSNDPELLDMEHPTIHRRSMAEMLLYLERIHGS